MLKWLIALIFLNWEHEIFWEYIHKWDTQLNHASFGLEIISEILFLSLALQLTQHMVAPASWPQVTVKTEETAFLGLLGVKLWLNWLKMLSTLSRESRQ